MCWKIKHKTKRAALAHARRARTLRLGIGGEGKPLGVFPCNQCGFFHVGSPPGSVPVRREKPRRGRERWEGDDTDG